MIFDEMPNHAQRFEQAIATTFACRNIIKYNSTLNEEQKNEILADLDSTLEFLRERFVANTAIESSSVIPPLQLAELLAASADDQDEEDEEVGEMGEAGERTMGGTDAGTRQDRQELSEPLMQGLYRLYHAYLSGRPGKGINALAERYRAAMSILDDVEATLRLQRDTSVGEGNEVPVYRVRGFISALYSMFHEFAAVLAELLEGKNIMAETDELTALERFAAGATRHAYMLRDITPLMRVYGTYLQFQQSKGSLTTLVNDATAFFIFLEEKLAGDFARRKEILERLRSVAGLFHDIASLLFEYEQAFAATLTR